MLADDPPPPPSKDDEESDAEAKKNARARLAKLRAALAEAEKAYASLSDDDDDRAETVSTEEDETLAADSGDDGEEDEDDDPPPPKDKPEATSRSASRSTAAARIVAAASAATGKTDPAEIVGALTALAKTNARNVSLSKRLAQLERKLQRSEVESLVSRAIKTGRLTPAEREWAIEYGMDSIAKLRGYLDVTPKRALLAGSEAREPQRGVALSGGAQGAGALVALSDVERRICQNTGIKPEKFAEVKNRPIRFEES
jgi:phage I-like protein